MNTTEKGWKSIARWPRDKVNLGNVNNESEDTHHTKEAAVAVCRRLERRGFGGDGEFFPVETRVEKIT